MEKRHPEIVTTQARNETWAAPRAPRPLLTAPLPFPILKEASILTFMVIRSRVFFIALLTSEPI